MSLGFDEPMPELPAPRSFRPLWIALVCAIAISFAVNMPTHSLWGLFAYLPWLVICGRTVIFSVRDHRRFDRDLDGWCDRMMAYYRRPIR